MIPGFNHNVRYRGRIFHCQTEDSGINNPHIITHLYVGGNILATKKTSYADIVKADHLEEVVTELMKDQHKEVIKRLVSGVFDTSIAQRSVGATSLNGPAPLNMEEGGQNRVSFGMGGGSPAPRPASKSDAVAAAKSAAMVAPPPMPIKPAPVAPPPVKAAPIEAPEVIDARALVKAPLKPPPPATGTIFGEDLISEKSLDEVILSYLADETNR